jgi:hypothetical protein
LCGEELLKGGIFDIRPQVRALFCERGRLDEVSMQYYNVSVFCVNASRWIFGAEGVSRGGAGGAEG